MECRDVRDALPLLDPAPAVIEHVDACPGCRERAAELEAAVRSLRDGLEELRSDPMTEEEMMDLVWNASPESPRRRIAMRVVAAAGVLIVAGAVLALLAGRDGPALFAEGPQVAGAGDVEVRPPPLRVPRSPSWDAEAYRALLVIDGEEAVLRLSYEPADGGERIRRAVVDECPRPPPPTDVPDALPAVLLATGPETPWRTVRRALASTGPVPLYLAGTEPGRTLGGVAFGTGPAMREVVRLGAAVTPKDFAGGIPPERVLRLRITRGDGGTRYRCGLSPLANPGPVGFGLGDRTVPDEDLAGPGGTAALPDLAARIDAPDPHPMRAVVTLEAGTGTRYLDVLRGIESVKGAFVIDLSIFVGVDPIRPPEPLHPADASALVEHDAPVRGTVFVNAYAQGKIRTKGIEVRPEAAVPAGAEFVILRADRDAPFTVCRAVIEAALAKGVEVRIAFAPEDPEIPSEREMTFPSRAEFDKFVEVTVGVGPDGAPEWTERPLGPTTGVRLVVPEGATAGRVLPVVLRMTRLGAAAIRFE